MDRRQTDSTDAEGIAPQGPRQQRHRASTGELGCSAQCPGERRRARQQRRDLTHRELLEPDGAGDRLTARYFSHGA